MFFFFLIPRTSHVYSHGFGVNIFNIIEKIKRLKHKGARFSSPRVSRVYYNCFSFLTIQKYNRAKKKNIQNNTTLSKGVLLFESAVERTHAPIVRPSFIIRHAVIHL